MATLVDASVLIAIERGTLSMAERLLLEPDEPLAIAAITASELLYGVHRARAGRLRQVREAFVERLLETLPVVPFDLVVARAHASMWAELAAKGIVIGAHDLQIAATAVAAGHRVATRDKRSFPRIPGLRVVIW
ncbi:MAG TPA: PIN domain-containing protein [Polyangiaceae bacterium]